MQPDVILQLKPEIFLNKVIENYYICTLCILSTFLPFSYEVMYELMAIFLLETLFLHLPG